MNQRVGSGSTKVVVPAVCAALLGLGFGMMAALGTGCRAKQGARHGGSAAASTPAGLGMCENACDKYIACGGVMARKTCVEECNFIYNDDAPLRDLMAMQCNAYVGYIDGPK